MNIFGVGTGEFILVMAIMLVIAGPKRMIRWAYVLGQAVGRLKGMWSEVAAQLQREFDQAGVNVKVPDQPLDRREIDRELRGRLRGLQHRLAEGPVDAAKLERDLLPHDHAEQPQDSGVHTRSA